jgi:hypothetical protein
MNGFPRLRFRHVVVAGLVLGAANLPVIRSTWLHFGATEAELDAEMHGDHRIEHANLDATRSVTIAAPPDEVWPWVAQIGSDRAGFYSYDGIESLLGSDVRSADQVTHEWQKISPGDRVRVHRSVWLDVVDVIPGRTLVLSRPDDEPGFAFTWEFSLRRSRHHSTRLVIRERYGYRSGWSALAAEPMALASFVMTEKMMRGIRSRAELARCQADRSASKTES